jgi:hypothetical protein
LKRCTKAIIVGFQKQNLRLQTFGTQRFERGLQTSKEFSGSRLLHIAANIDDNADATHAFFTAPTPKIRQKSWRNIVDTKEAEILEVTGRQTFTRARQTRYQNKLR